MKQKTILAVASGGGHWEQLNLIGPAFADHTVVYATTAKWRSEGVYGLPECSRSTWWRAGLTVLRLIQILLRTRPDIVVSTGALPGLLALLLGRILGAQTIWIDSVANAEEMSFSGRMSKWVADLWLTQWPSVAARTGARFAGSVL